MPGSGQLAASSTPHDRASDARRRLLGVRAARVLVPILSIAAFLGIWQLEASQGVIATRDLSSMTTTFHELWRLMQGKDTAVLFGDTNTFWDNVGYTVRGWAIGLGVATALAVPIGILLGTNDFLYRAFRVPIEFLRPIPSAVLIPLLFLTIGINLKSEVFLAAFGAFWPLLIQTMYGVHDVDPTATDTARSFGVGRFERLYRIVLPSAVPYIATGIRISSNVALILAFTAELFMGMPGLGHALSFAQSNALTSQLYAIAVATGFLGLVIYLVFSRLERRALRWHPSQRVTVQ